MGTNLPSSDHAALLWLEGHIAGWLAAPAAIGLTSAQVTDLATDINNVRTDFTSVESLRSDAKVATQAFHTNGKALRVKAAGLITNIKSYATTVPSAQQVYDAAGLLTPSPPTPAAPPQVPTDIRRTIEPDGAVTLKWSGRGPVGTVYNVTRKLATEAAFSFVGQGNASDKSFTDATVAPGTVSATYIIQGVRGDLVGLQSQPVTVYFGAAGSGAMAAAA
jgi:hypothetical protein